jgi:hypothetical protein
MSVPPLYNTVSINQYKCYVAVTDGMTAVYNEDRRSMAAQLF